MSFLDKAKAKLTGAVDQHGDKIDQATGKARDALDNLDGKNDDIPPAPPAR
jgi:hypothetical protein